MHRQGRLRQPRARRWSYRCALRPRRERLRRPRAWWRWRKSAAHRGNARAWRAYICRARQFERLRALLIRRQNGLLQRLAGGGAHLVHSGEAHATPFIERHIKARGLKGRGAHAAHMLNQVCRLDGGVLAASTVKPAAVAVSAGSSQQVSVTANGSPKRATTVTSTARRRSTSRLSAAPAASMARWLRMTRTRQPSGMLRGTRQSTTSPAAASSVAIVVNRRTRRRGEVPTSRPCPRAQTAQCGRWQRGDDGRRV